MRRLSRRQEKKTSGSAPFRARGRPAGKGEAQSAHANTLCGMRHYSCRTWSRRRPGAGTRQNAMTISFPDPGLRLGSRRNFFRGIFARQAADSLWIPQPRSGKTLAESWEGGVRSGVFGHMIDRIDNRIDNRMKPRRTQRTQRR